MKLSIYVLAELITFFLFFLVVISILFHIVKFRMPGDFSWKMFVIFLVISTTIIFLSVSGLGIIWAILKL